MGTMDPPYLLSPFKMSLMHILLNRIVVVMKLLHMYYSKIVKICWCQVQNKCVAQIKIIKLKLWPISNTKEDLFQNSERKNKVVKNLEPKAVKIPSWMEKVESLNFFLQISFFVRKSENRQLNVFYPWSFKIFVTIIIQKYNE